MKNRLLHSFLNPQVITLVMIAGVCIFGHWISVEVARSLFTLSLLIKDALMLFLPYAVFVYIAHTLSQFKTQALLLVLSLMVFEAFSNALSVNYAWAFAHMIEDVFNITLSPHSEAPSLTPYFQLGSLKPAFWSPSLGTYSGVITGLLLAIFSLPILPRFIERGKKAADYVFQNIFARLIPLFILGYLLNLAHSGQLEHLASTYGVALLWIVGAIILYVTALYSASSGFSLSRFMTQLRHTLPTGFMAFTSGSSAATMPLTIEAARKNVRDPEFASMVIPATTNIQQIGDCIANVLFAALLMKTQGWDLPGLSVWLPFMTVYVLARFTTAAVMGGAIFILLPIFEAYLGFTPEMVALLLAFNLIMDPIVTSSNVMANGALCILFETTWEHIKSFVPSRRKAVSSRKI